MANEGIVFGDPSEWRDRPGVHVLIAGVSHYTHLPEDGSAAPFELFGLKQLHAMARSAFKLSEWLIAHQDKLALPLATCRLLLSPAAAEKIAEPRLIDRGIPCTMPNFLAAASAWREDAAQHDDNITIFYFAGHGVLSTAITSLLLMEDFGASNGGTLRNTADFNTLIHGMMPTNLRPVMAQRQIYLLDACQVLPERLHQIVGVPSTAVFDVELSLREIQSRPIVLAAGLGSSAFAQGTKSTIFCEALLKCLDSTAVDGEQDADGNVTWKVTANSLCSSIEGEVAKLVTAINASRRSVGDLALNQMCNATPDHGGDKIILNRLDEPPTIEIELGIDPNEAAALNVTQLEIVDSDGHPVTIMDSAGHPVPAIARPLAPNPSRFRVPGGFYKINARIIPPNHPIFRDRLATREVLITPARSSWIKRVGS